MLLCSCVVLSLFCCVFCRLLRHVTLWRARGVDTVEGSRTRQHAQTGKQIAVVLTPLVPFFVRDGCRSLPKHRALRMLPFAEQRKRSLVFLGTGSTAACGLQQCVCLCSLCCVCRVSVVCVVCVWCCIVCVVCCVWCVWYESLRARRVCPGACLDATD